MGDYDRYVVNEECFCPAIVDLDTGDEYPIEDEGIFETICNLLNEKENRIRKYKVMNICNELLDEPKKCACISTKRMYLLLSKIQEKLLQECIDKREITDLIISVKHDLLLLDNKENHIERDLFR